MKRNIFLLLFLCILAFPARAGINKAEAEAWVMDKGARLLAALDERDLSAKYAALDKMLADDVDVDYIAQFVIGKYWKAMTAEQRRAYLEIFRRYVTAVYRTLPLDFHDRLDFKVQSASLQGEFADVAVKVSLGEPQKAQGMSGLLDNIALTFRLRKAGGRVKLADIKLAESSLLLSYRARFYEMMLKDDEEIPWFLEDLEDMARSFEARGRSV